MNKYSLSVLKFLVVLSGLCSFGCQDEITETGTLKVTEIGNKSALTIEEARVIYEDYTATHTRSGIDICQNIPLNPGKIENDWEYAATSLSGANSYVSVPSQVSKTYLAKSPHNVGWVRLVQKLVVVQEDSSRRNDVYLLSIIPEGKYVKAYPEVIAEICKGGHMPDDFSGLIVYTRLEGGMVLYAGGYQEGLLEKSVFVFDKNYSFEENINRLNEVLKGYCVEEVKESTRSLLDWNEGGDNTGDGDNWMYHTEGPSFWQDGYKCWYATDGYGRRYIVADTDFDNRPDTILGEVTTIGGGGDGSGGGNISIGGGNTGGTGGGNINPGGPITPTPKPNPNPEPESDPADLSAYHGKDEYYLKRKEDFEKRNPGKTAPDYYENYGDFYLREFKYKTRPTLSPEGQRWCDSTLLFLQQAMTQLLTSNKKIELNSALFTSEAFKSHVDAYYKAGICQLSIMDKVKIGLTVYWSDLKSPEGTEQIIKIWDLQMNYWKEHPSFAMEQHREFMQNRKEIGKLVVKYLQREDPRKAKTKSTTITPEEIIRVLWGDWIDYFEENFGYEFDISEFGC